MRQYPSIKKPRRSLTYKAFFVLEAGLEPAQPQWPKDFKSFVSTIPPFEHPQIKRGKRAENETRTRDPNLGKVVLYQLSYFRIGRTDAKISSFPVPAKYIL